MRTHLILPYQVYAEFRASLPEIIVLKTGRTNVQLQEYRVDKCVDEAEKEMSARPKDSATPRQHGCIKRPLKETCKNITNLSDRFTSTLTPDLQVQQNQR